MAVNRDSSKNLNIGGASLYIKTKDDTNFRFFASTSALKLNVKADKIEHKNTDGAVSVVDFEAIVSESATVSITTEELNKEVLAMAFGGNYTETTQNGDSETDYEIDGVKGGYLYSLDGKVEVSNVVVKYKDGDDDKVAEEDVDYSVEYKFGNIEIAVGGAIDGKDIKVDFDYATIKVTEISALDDVSKEISIRVAQTLQNGQPKEFVIHRVILALNGDYDLKSIDKFTSITLDGNVLIDSTKPEKDKFYTTKMVG